jgi:hypothetical protein
MIERTTVRLPSDLLDRARRKAAREKRTLTALIEDGLRMVCSENAEKQPRIVPRVSSASGPPGSVDLPPFRVLEEEDDLERLRKLGAIK